MILSENRHPLFGIMLQVHASPQTTQIYAAGYRVTRKPRLRKLQRRSERFHSPALIGIGQKTTHGAEIVGHMGRIGGAGDDGGDARVAQQIFQEKLRPGVGERARPVWHLLSRTARKSRARPSGKAVSTAAFTSSAAGSTRLSASRSSSE